MTFSVNSENASHFPQVQSAAEPTAVPPNEPANPIVPASPAETRPAGETEPRPATEPVRGGTATAVRPLRAPVKPEPLRPWRVLLHNDDRNDMDYVVDTIVKIVRLNRPSATRCMMEAHRKGAGQVIATHRERAEFLAEQLRSRRLTVTIEPVE
jgi:ATP-dependent Clp protease adapter protein ClpS